MLDLLDIIIFLLCCLVSGESGSVTLGLRLVKSFIYNGFDQNLGNRKMPGLNFDQSHGIRSSSPYCFWYFRKTNRVTLASSPFFLDHISIDLTDQQKLSSKLLKNVFIDNCLINISKLNAICNIWIKNCFSEFILLLHKN